MKDIMSRLRGSFLLIVLVVISALLVSACGGANDSNTSNNDATADSESATVDTSDLPSALPEDLELDVPNANELYEVARGSTDGELLFTTFCAKCHGLQGLGDGSSAGSLHIEGNFVLTILADRSDEELLETITFGKGIDMPPWGLILSLEQREAVLAYVRTLAQ